MTKRLVHPLCQQRELVLGRDLVVIGQRRRIVAGETGIAVLRMIRLAPRFADLKSHRIVALAGGTSKTRAIRAILAHGLLFGLITDEATAKRLVSLKPGREPGKKNGKPAPG